MGASIFTDRVRKDVNGNGPQVAQSNINCTCEPLGNGDFKIPDLKALYQESLAAGFVDESGDRVVFVFNKGNHVNRDELIKEVEKSFPDVTSVKIQPDSNSPEYGPLRVVVKLNSEAVKQQGEVHSFSALTGGCASLRPSVGVNGTNGKGHP